MHVIPGIEEDGADVCGGVAYWDVAGAVFRDVVFQVSSDGLEVAELTRELGEGRMENVLRACMVR